MKTKEVLEMNFWGAFPGLNVDEPQVCPYNELIFRLR